MALLNSIHDLILSTLLFPQRLNIYSTLSTSPIPPSYYVETFLIQSLSTKSKLD